MIIVSVVPTLNEEKNIRLYCERHDFVDLIIVSDGGSIDKTVEIAKSFKNVMVIEYPNKIAFTGDPNGYMNPEGSHYNHGLIEARQHDPDWIIFSDCDEFPNKHLQKGARHILSNTKEQAVGLYRFNLWGKNKYFPKMMDQNARVLWAFRPKLTNVVYKDDLSHATYEAAPTEMKKIGQPYAIVHNFCPDEETVQKKMARYEAWGKPQVHPLRWKYAPPVKLPKWANVW